MNVTTKESDPSYTEQKCSHDKDVTPKKATTDAITTGKSKGWWSVLETHSNLVKNFDWTKATWDAQKGEKSVKILAVSAEEDTTVKGPAQLWLVGTIDSAYLTTGKYSS